MNKTLSEWIWPANAPAAVSLTYDDGTADQLEHAMPALEAQGLRGTFYLNIENDQMQARKDEWKAAFTRGHEIGNHSVHHPARADAYANIPNWLPPEHWLENYTPADIMNELDESAEWLNTNIGPDPLRTYAYPCCHMAIGDPPDEASYDTAVLKHHFAARDGGMKTNDPHTVNLLRVSGYGFDHPASDELIGYCKAAFEIGGWTVLVFHGVGGSHLKTELDVHTKLLEYLLSKRFWVAPFRDIADYIRQNRA